MDKILQPLLQSPKLPDYVEALKRVLEEEEVKRKELYDWFDEDKRAEFISGEVIIHSPARLLHIVVLKRLVKIIDDFVENNNLGIVLSAQALVKLKHNDVMPDLAFGKIRRLPMILKYFRLPVLLLRCSVKARQNMIR